MCHAATVISGLSHVHTVCVCATAGLPDENGRVAILQIHTKLMRAHGKLANDVDLGRKRPRTSVEPSWRVSCCGPGHCNE